MIKVQGIKMKYLALAALAASLASSPAVSQERSVTLDVRPEGFIPQRGSADIFSLGFGGSLAATIEGDSPTYLRTSIGYLFLPTLGTEGMNFVTGKAGGGLRLDLGSTLTFRLGLAAGGFLGSYDNLIGYNPSVEAEGGIQFNLNSGFKLGLGGGYGYHVGNISTAPFTEKAFLEGFNFSIAASFVPGGGPTQLRNPRLDIGNPEFQPIFPVFYQYYNDQALGTVTITNKERKAITNVSVSFFVNQYMEAPKQSIHIDRLAPGESVDIPILGLFKDSMLEITEGTTVVSQIIVEYEEGKASLTTTRNDSVRILNRNNLTWDDDRKAAAFVTARDPTVQRFARNVLAANQQSFHSSFNTQFQQAMAMYQALFGYGLKYVIDPDSSFIQLSQNEAAIDYVQFPVQTLENRSGDCDDLSVLFAALMEAIGVQTAFLTTPGHIFVAVNLGMDRAEAARVFTSASELVEHEGSMWLPIEITLVQSENFIEAWRTGARQVREAQRNSQLDVFPVRSAWTQYPATGFSSTVAAIPYPDGPAVPAAFRQEYTRFVRAELAPRVADLQGRIQQSGGSTRLMNNLGILYAQYGLYDEASQVFNDILRKENSLSALVNLGNIQLIAQNWSQAIAFYQRALVLRADDPITNLNMARALHRLERFPESEQRYRTAALLNPQLAQRFSYLDPSASTGSARASSAAADDSAMMWKED
jgi:tetratricopeptide (TPR) repeat protein